MQFKRKEMSFTIYSKALMSHILFIFSLSTSIFLTSCNDSRESLPKGTASPLPGEGSIGREPPVGIINQPSDASRNRTGCVQGSLVDGLTGAPIKVPNASATSGIYVLVRNIPIPAINIGSNQASVPESSPSPSGPTLFESEYLACNIPLDENFPIFAYINNYVQFEGIISIKSTVNDRDTAQQLLLKPAPTTIGNIRVFPTGTETKNFEFVLTNNGRFINRATIYVSAARLGFIEEIDPLGTFINPLHFRGGTITAESNSDGIAIIPANKLSLGLLYNFTIRPPSATFLSSFEGTFTYGLVPEAIPSAVVENFRYPVELASTVPELKLLSVSLENGTFDRTGKIEFIFNRSIEFIENTKGSLTVALQHGPVSTAASAVQCPTASPTCTNIQILPIPIPNPLNISPNVEITSRENVLVLTPKFNPGPTSSPPSEYDRGLSVLYDLVSVKIRPTGEIGTANEKSLQSLLEALPAGRIPPPVGNTPRVYIYE